MSAYTIDLLYAQLPTLDGEQLLRQLREACGQVDMRIPPRHAGALLFTFPGQPFVDRPGQTQIPQLLVAPRAAPLAYEQLRPAQQQSRDWPALASILPQHSATILVSDFLVNQTEYQHRLQRFHQVVRAVLSLAPALAIHWQPSQCLVPTEHYLTSYDPLFPLIHTRHFQVEDPTLDEMVVDTCGLAALGLPDLQCHFRGLDPEAVGQALYQTARILFAQGDLLRTGDTIQGIPADQRWLCQRSLALIGPVREVIDIQPKPPYAPIR